MILVIITFSIQIHHIDVVAAYKSVQAEKDALEASLSALSTAVPTGQVEAEGSGEGKKEVKDGETAEDGESPNSSGSSKQVRV